eukprot:c26483_g3_i1 orf=414-875(+)
MDNIKADSRLVESDCGKNKLRVRGQSQGSCMSDLFWVTKANEIDSPSRTLKYKSKYVSQKVIGACNFCQEINSADYGESKWQDLPMELLIRILSLVDHRTVIVASGVCTGWKDAICSGILEISFSWCKKNTSKLVQSVAPKFNRLQVCNLSLR